MRYLCLILFLLLSTSFTKNEPELIWIGTVQVFFNPETDEFVLYYNGDYQRCFTKFIIDEVYNDCDSLIDINYLREKLQFKPTKPDSSQITPKDTIKTISM